MHHAFGVRGFECVDDAFEDANGFLHPQRVGLDALEQFHKDGGKAKQQLAKEITAEAEQRKRQKALAEVRRRAIGQMLIGFRDARGQSDPARAMQALIENLGQHELPQGFVDVAGHQRAIYGLALADLDAMLTEFRKTLVTGQTRNKARLSNVVRELHGEKTGDELAASFAIAVAKVTEARIYGFPVEALCGERFVPQQDPKKLPLCGVCKEIYDLYRQAGDGGLSETPGS